METVQEKAPETTAEEVAALRRKVESLTSDELHPAVVATADKAQQGVDWLKRETEHWSTKVQAKPLTSVALAAAAGFVLAKVTRR